MRRLISVNAMSTLLTGVSVVVISVNFACYVLACSIFRNTEKLVTLTEIQLNKPLSAVGFVNFTDFLVKWSTSCKVTEYTRTLLNGVHLVTKWSSHEYCKLLLVLVLLTEFFIGYLNVR